MPAPLFPGLPALPAKPQRFEGQSLRQQMVSALGGERVRVRFSNLFGRQPLRIVEASVALAAGADAVAPASLQRLRFGGRTGVTIAPGREAWSDGARLAVEPGQAVAVSYQVEAGTPFATLHPLGATVTVPGAAVMRANWPGAAPSPIQHVVTGLDVAPQAAPRVVVAFGDSITQGTGNGEAPPASYPDRLAARLREQPGGHGAFAVINAGIGGNRLLVDGTGPRGVERFRRDALGQSGVTHVLILIGINDLGVSLPVAMQGLSPAFRPASAEQLAAGPAAVDRAGARPGREGAAGHDHALQGRRLLERGEGTAPAGPEPLDPRPPGRRRGGGLRPGAARPRRSCRDEPAVRQRRPPAPRPGRLRRDGRCDRPARAARVGPGVATKGDRALQKASGRAYKGFTWPREDEGSNNS